MLQLQSITLRRGSKTLLNQASVRIDTGHKVGLIGRNGTGKTSLMKLLIGELHEDHGSVLLPKGWKIAYLSQALPETNDTALHFVRNGDNRWVDLQQAITDAEKDNQGVQLANLHVEMEFIDGYRIDTRAAIILKGLGFSESDFQKPVKSFSGGWQMRLQLARLLIAPADLLLLDEPTNHLDLESIVWLEKWLQSYTGTLIAIAHDRYFLDHVTTQTLYMAHEKMTLYQGNYSSFAKQFQEALLLQEKTNQKIIKQRLHLQKFVDRFRAKATKAKQAQSRLRAMEKLQVSCELQEEREASFYFFESKPTGYPAITIRANLGYSGKTILKNVSLNVGDGDRIGVIGLNGSGKSTLLKSIAQQLPAISGEMSYHTNTQIGYFSQQQVEMLNLNETPLMHFLRLNETIKESEARSFLGYYGFNRDRVHDAVSQFSGGEKARLALALLIWKRPNVLLLDEPTNHLDMQTKEALILALEDFKGALLLVSHDRYFIECCVNELWLVKNNQITTYAGNLTDYESEQCTETGSKEKVINQDVEKQLKKLEKELTSLQNQLKKIENRLEDPTIYTDLHNDKLKELLKKQRELKMKMKLVEEEWLNQI